MIYFMYSTRWSISYIQLVCFMEKQTDIIWCRMYSIPPISFQGSSRHRSFLILTDTDWAMGYGTTSLKHTAAAAKSLQSCPTLCNPIDGSPSGSPVPGILQARTLEWVAISFSNAWEWKVKLKSLSRVQLLVTPWTAAYQAPLSMGFSRRECWSGVPLPSPNVCLVKVFFQFQRI